MPHTAMMAILEDERFSAFV